MELYSVLQVNKLSRRHIKKTKHNIPLKERLLKAVTQSKAINSFSEKITKSKSTTETGFALIQVELPSGIKFKQSGYNQLEEERNKRTLLPPE